MNCLRHHSVRCIGIQVCSTHTELHNFQILQKESLKFAVTIRFFHFQDRCTFEFQYEYHTPEIRPKTASSSALVFVDLNQHSGQFCPIIAIE